MTDKDILELIDRWADRVERLEQIVLPPEPKFKEGEKVLLPVKVDRNVSDKGVIIGWLNAYEDYETTTVSESQLVKV